MIGDRYVLLVWSGVSLIPWLAIYLAWPAERRALVWSSCFAVPFGLSEVMFAGSYWSPPSLFGLAARIHLDLESFVFLFGAGGLAATAYDIATRTHARPAFPPAPPPLRNAAFATPACAFAIALVVVREPIWAGSIAMVAGALARVLVRPDLAAKTTLGGLMFALYYVALLGTLAALHPDYIASVWSGRPLLAGIPLTELAFGTSFGLYWSGLYEQYAWTFSRTRGARPSLHDVHPPGDGPPDARAPDDRPRPADGDRVHRRTSRSQ